MKIKLNENKIIKVMLNEIQQDLSKSQYNNKIKADNDVLKNILNQYGKIMVNIKTNKEYIVYELKEFLTLLGKRYGICRVITDGKPYGTMLVKPMINFKNKI